MKKHSTLNAPIANIFAPAPKIKANPIGTLFQPRPALDADVELPAFMALSMLTSGCGTAEAVLMVLTRLKLGRLTAYLFFDDSLANKMHLIIQSYFAWTSTLRDEDTNMSIPAGLLKRVTEGFALTREMHAKLNIPDVQRLTYEFMKQENTPLIESDHDYVETCNWEDFKYFWDMPSTSRQLLVECY